MFPMDFFTNIFGLFQSSCFNTSGPSKIVLSPAIFSEPLQETMRNMNQVVQKNVLSVDVTMAIWQGWAIMCIDGSVQGKIVTYFFVISILKNIMQLNVCKRQWIPPPNGTVHGTIPDNKERRMLR
jgi:hypothetical protein